VVLKVVAKREVGLVLAGGTAATAAANDATAFSDARFAFSAALYSALLFGVAAGFSSAFASARGGGGGAFAAWFSSLAAEVVAEVVAVAVAIAVAEEAATIFASFNGERVSGDRDDNGNRGLSAPKFASSLSELCGATTEALWLRSFKAEP